MQPASVLPVGRSVFVSDLHLGYRGSQRERFLNFLGQLDCEQLYLVGDIVDIWRLRAGSPFTELDRAILDSLTKLSFTDTRVTYLPGNHDAAMRHGLFRDSRIRICDEVIHQTTDGRKYLVVHGDRFDSIERSLPWLSEGAMRTYDWTVRRIAKLKQLPFKPRSNRLLNLGWQSLQRCLCALQRGLDAFVWRALGASRRIETDGVICGHTHAPHDWQSKRGHYLNTGDWVRNSTAIVEDDLGRLNLRCFSANSTSNT